MRNPFRRRAARTITRLGKDEDGAVMVITVILGMLLFKAVLSTYNVGALAAEKMRLQMTADAAAYSAAVWQARFLNYVAYVRRAAIANYAHVGYITAVESHYPHMEKYDDEETELLFSACGNSTIDPDHGSIQIAASALVPNIAIIPGYKGVRDFLVGLEREQEAQKLAKSHADVAKAMYAFVRRPSLVAQDIVNQANLPIGGKELATIRLNSAAMNLLEDGSMQGVLNDNWIELVPMEDFKLDVSARFDDFTMARNAPELWMARPFNGDYVDFVVILDFFLAFACQSTLCQDQNFRFHTASIDISADALQDDWSGGTFTTSDGGASGMYYEGTGIIPTPISVCIPVPVFVPIRDSDENEGESDISLHEQIELFDLRASAMEHLEPSLYVALQIDRAEFVGSGAGEADPEGAKRLLHHRGIPLGRAAKTMTAVARAKVAFQSMNKEHRFYKPNLYYPYWEAVLAPIYGPGRPQCNSTLRANGDAILRKAIEGKGLRLDSNADFEEYANGVHF